MKRSQFCAYCSRVGKPAGGIIFLQLISLPLAPTLQAAEGKSKLPQLDPATFEPQLIWLFISFLVLYLLMSRTALPKIGAILEERADRRADDLDQADRARKESECIETSYQEILAEARAGSAKMFLQARQELNSDMEARKAEMAAKLAKRLDKAEAAIALAKEKAMKDLEGIAAETCQAIVEKLSGRMTAKKETAAAVQNEIKALN